MIVDFPCDIENCTAPVEFVKGQKYQSTNGVVTIFFLRCLNQHYYMKAEDNSVAVEQIETTWHQPELPFDN